MQNAKKLIPLTTFCLYFLKIIILSPNYTDAGVLLILGVLSAFFEFKSNDGKIQELENKFNKHQREIEDKNKEIESIKTYLNSIKLSQTMRPLGNVNR